TVSLSWNQVEGADKYRIYRKDSNGNISLLEEIEQEENLSYIDYIPLGEYIYWLTAVNQYGEGPLSDKKTVVVSEVASSEPQAPTALEGQALSGSKIELNWTDNSDNELTFVIERQDEGGEWQEIVRTAYNSTHYIDVQLQPASNYNYRIKAENSAGASEYSTVISVPTLDLPVAVTDLRWEVISANQIKVEWEDTPNEGSYRVELFKLTNDEEIMGEEVVDIQFLSANMTYCYFVTLEPGREYRVRLTTIVGEDEVSIESDIIRTSADSKGGLF
ncbi:MAG: fibronectin type III domain-containing protein, partial [Halanaerobiales bacterium]